MQALIFTLFALVVAAGNFAYDNLKIGQRNTEVQRANTSRQAVAQAESLLVSEYTDGDGDGYAEPPAFATLSAGPTAGGAIPTASAAGNLVDGWGSKIGYCPFDNGSSNSSTNRINGDNPGAQSSVLFSLVSAGPDRSFSTSCAQSKTNTAQGDDSDCESAK